MSGRVFAWSDKDDTCRWCGRKLHRNGRYASSEGRVPDGGRITKRHVGGGCTYVDTLGEKGYRSAGYFCTANCAWRFGLALARDGIALNEKMEAEV
jgi:hypothetical protein